MDKDMKSFEFGDNRKIFKYLIIFLLISILIGAVNAIIAKVTHQNILGVYAFLIFIYSIVILAVKGNTKEQIFMGDTSIKINKTIPYMLIDKIAVQDGGISIYNGQESVKIRVLDLKSNYDKYEEILELILCKVNAKVKRETVGAKVLLEKVKANKESIAEVPIMKNGKPKLGGWLKFYMVIYYGLFVSGLSVCVPIVIQWITKADFALPTVDSIRYAFMEMMSLLMIIALHRRKKNVKYFYAVMQLLTMGLSIFTIIQSILASTQTLEIILRGLSIVLLIISNVLMIKVAFEYVDNFPRPKNTLIN